MACRLRIGGSSTIATESLSGHCGTAYGLGGLNAVRQRIEEIGEQIAELTGLLEIEEAERSRLVITRETVEEIAGEAAQVSAGPTVEAVSAEMVRAAEGSESPIGVLTVPPWRPGMRALVLPEAYRDAVEILADAAEPMRAGQIAVAKGLEDSAAKREGLRSKLKRLVERGWAVEDGPGLFTLAAPVTRELVTGPGEGGDGIGSSPMG
ncbi:hypothetical protein [Actinomadura sp. 9N215]|uniref:hypothetical protein n=1 Tax=Actinomadura sp. 9N215 TaxID=3375150 RepID=UPI0037A024D1